MEGGKVGTPSSPVSQSPPPGKPGSVVLPPAPSPPAPSAEPSGTPPQTGAMKERRTSAELRRGTEGPSPELRVTVIGRHGQPIRTLLHAATPPISDPSVNCDLLIRGCERPATARANYQQCHSTSYTLPAA
ncbi:nascent polypeptide-associated complex subunit alpha, muscle-specific form-like isoform X1 [Polyodon spathula]|uniref:nascent polypeptide-associated complex subunit alpha, muscle-specific form-like isoform X1 n=1 Tax=Polyodon spathula TaxID=7913 RepID=UPI001B7F41DF|nr:nascent polypeptide-associated complex subunit alpha, muscle-specific form-like isoform X1 [Polyodon spathula]XP_041093223.1 nascent polypeptide-associated complex subunit alpha, muscle-specific form-like isoform X1 [Polyodon spathula]